MNALTKLFKGFENAMSAVTFAEAGEYETARKIMGEEMETAKNTRKERGVTYEFKTPAVKEG